MAAPPSEPTEIKHHVNRTENKTPESQQTVYEHFDAKYSLFYWIYINSTRGNKIAKEAAHNMAKFCSQIYKIAKKVDETGLRVGVGFGKRFLEQIEDKLLVKKPNTEKQPKFSTEEAQKEWKEKQKELCKKYTIPSAKLDYQPFAENDQNEKTGGDIFFHVKGKSEDILINFHKELNKTLPKRYVDMDKTSIDCGFTINDNRDLSGYKLGIGNPQTTTERFKAAVVKNTGGSFAITQKWRHRTTINSRNCDPYIGRKKESGEWLETVPEHAHAGLMKTVQQGNHPIVRQSLPCICDGVGGGLFFLAYSKDTLVFQEMLQELRNNDLINFMSRYKGGTYWYFPGIAELNDLFKDDDNDF